MTNEQTSENTPAIQTQPSLTIVGGCPRIYAASLSDYNAGILHGRWIDANQSAEAIHAEIQAMLNESKESLAEEWAIHDYEGFGQWGLREFECIDAIAAVARCIAEHGEVFAGLMGHCSDIEEAHRYMQNGYRGEFESVKEYAETFIDDVYGSDVDRLPEIIRYHIDFEGIARDFELSGDIFTIECDRKVHIFDSNI